MTTEQVTPTSNGTPPSKTWIEWTTTSVNGITALATAIAGLLGAVFAIYNALPPKPIQHPSLVTEANAAVTSSICQFSDGYIDYSSHPGLSIGSICQDGTGHSGQIVANGAGAEIKVSTICQFTNGWHDYSPAVPYRIDTLCQDGRGNSGKVVVKGTGPQL